MHSAIATLRSIIRHLEIEFSVFIDENLTDDVRIENVQYLLPGSADSLECHAFTLYIGDYGEFSRLVSRGSFLFLNTPANAAAAYSQSAYIKQALEPFAVCNSVQNALFLSHQANMRKEEMFHILQGGYGIQAILDTARTILDNPITMCTTSFSVLATSPKEAIHETMEVSGGKYYFKKQAIANMRQTKVIERLYHSSAPFVASFDDDIGIEYIFCGIRIQRAVVGYLCLRSVVRKFTEEDFDFLQDVVRMLSIEMQKDSFYNHQTGLAYEYFLRDLIEQNIESADFALHRMTQLGRPAGSYFWVMAFAFIENSGRKLNSKYYIDQMTGIFRGGICCFYSGSLILLLTGNHPDPFKGIDLSKFHHFIQLNQLRSAISYRYEQILHTHLYYQQTIFQLQNPNFPETDSLSLYEEHYHSHLFSMVPNHAALKPLIHPDITFLMDYDRQNNTDYIVTLQAYYRNSRNALKTSNDLHIHKSTFFYRMGKIESLTSLNLENSALLFAYEFSFYLLNYLNIYR